MQLFNIIKAWFEGWRREGGVGRSHRGSRWRPPELADIVKEYAQPWVHQGIIRNPTLDKVRFIFQKRILHSLIRTVKGDKVFITEAAKHIFLDEGVFKKDRAKYVHFLIPSLMHPVEIWKEVQEDGTFTDTYIGAFRHPTKDKYLMTFVVVPQEKNLDRNWKYWVLTMIPNKGRGRNIEEKELKWAAWRDEPKFEPKVWRKSGIDKGIIQSTPDKLLCQEPLFGTDQPHPGCLERVSPIPLNTKAHQCSRFYPHTGLIRPYDPEYTLKRPQLDKGTSSSPLIKAWTRDPSLRRKKESTSTTSPAWERDPTAPKIKEASAPDIAPAIMARVQSNCNSLEEDLNAFLQVWEQDVAVWQGNHKRYGKWAAEKHLDKLQASAERVSRNIIRKWYETQWSLGREAAGTTRQPLRDEVIQLTRMRRNEQQYFINLIRDARLGTWGMSPQRRIKMYANASKEAFWAAYGLADIRTGRYLKWEMGAKEHCGDCLIMAEGGRWEGTQYAGTFAARELAKIGIYPASGDLQCCTHCGCRLKEVPRPPVEPKTTKLITKMPIRGTKHNSFTGQGREGRENLNRRAHYYRWTHNKRINKSLDLSIAKAISRLRDKSTFERTI